MMIHVPRKTMITMECPISRHGIPNYSYLFLKFSCVEPLSQLLSARRTKPKKQPKLLEVGSGSFEWTNGGGRSVEVVVFFWHFLALDLIFVEHGDI